MAIAGISPTLCVTAFALCLSSADALGQADPVAERYRSLGRSLAKQGSACLESVMKTIGQDQELSAKADYPFGSELRHLVMERQCQRFCSQAQHLYAVCVASHRDGTLDALPAPACEAFRQGFDKANEDEIKRICEDRFTDRVQQEKCADDIKVMFCAPIVPVR